ncbi:MAG: Uncharacterized protein AUREO_025500 [Aureobasidium pullulans]|nr:MAG: Uncharacterized protein AUREO_025500 [Aureobasidium pullulans]
MPPYPGDPPEWRTFSGSYLDWQPSDEDSSTVTTLTTENERLRAELAGVREELAAARGRADRRDSDRLTHYEWLGRTATKMPSNNSSSTSVTTIGSTKSSTPDKGIVPADNLVKKANGQKSVAATPSGFKFIFEDEMLQHLMLLNS